jgi:RNA-binding protein 8A
VEGWILIVSNLHEETQEDDVFDSFSKYGEIKSLHLNMDRKTGYAKGYALIEYAGFEEAQAAIREMQGEELYDRKLTVDWAFQEKPLQEHKKPK